MLAVSQATWNKTRRPLAPRVMRLVREVGFYVLAAVGIYLLVALWTYSPQDPAWSHSGVPGGTVANAGGPVGAWLADILYYLFGYFAYVFPVMAAVTGWRIYLNRKNPEPPDFRHQALAATGFVLTLVGGGGLADLHFSAWAAEMPFRAGGVLGEAAAALLTDPFSFTGATLFLLALFFSGVTLATGLSWLRVMDVTGREAMRLVQVLRQAVAAGVDRLVGLRARQARRETVQEEKRVLERHPPPRIEPVIKQVPQGGRVEREKQVPLFDIAASGELPPLKLLDEPDESKPSFSKQSLEQLSRLVEKKLLDFGIEVQVTAVHPGPVITRFELETAPGIKASQITHVARDLARALSVISLRVVENIPGRPTVGLEIPNESREIVRLREILSSSIYDEQRSPLALALGKDIGGGPVVVDLARMPHLLIAGTTGSGKSVCIHAITLSMLYKSTTEQLRLIMIDPKMLELAVYEGIPHLLAPVVTDMKQAANALKWCVGEMDRRYRLMAALGVRNIAGYNQKVRDAEKQGKPLNDPLAEPIDGMEPPVLKALPYVVIVIDELADLMMVVGKKVEELIARLAQKARAAGLHLVVATQRPSVDVITGLIKANIASRIAFQMSSRVDSRTVLDQMGAEQLLGHGDMLFLQPGAGVPTRVHGAYVSDGEVHQVVAFLRKTGTPAYNEGILLGEHEAAEEGGGFLAGIEGSDEDDPLYQEALKIVLETRRASISSVQRRLRIGYNRAARLMEEMERAGIVGALQPNGSREVLVPANPRES